MTNCRRNNGGTDCKALFWGVNTCLALAISESDGPYGFDADPNRARAGQKSLAQCQKFGGKSCFVLTTPCATDDPR